MKFLGIVILLEKLKGETDIGGGPKRILLYKYYYIQILLYILIKLIIIIYNYIHLNAINTI